MRFGSTLRSLLVGICIFVSLSGCQRGEYQQETGMDYNQYIYAHGRVAYTPEAYIFLERGIMQVLEPTLSAPLSPLCTRPDCAHTDDSCSAWVDTTAVFAVGDSLYYVGQNEAGTYGVYQLNTTGKERRRIKEIPVVSGVNCGFSSRIYGSYLALEVTTWDTEAPSYMVYLTDYTDPEAEFSMVLGGEENTQTAYVGVELRDGWLFAQAMDVQSQELTLVGYNIQTGQPHTLVEDWDAINAYSLRDQTLYWAAPGDGFYALSLEDGEETKLAPWDADVGVGLAVYDDQYVYVTNALPQTVETGGETQGLYVYDYEGGQVAFVPVEGEGQSPVFLLSTPQYVFFYDAAQGMSPKWYLDKGDLSQGKAAWSAVPQAS